MKKHLHLRFYISAFRVKILAILIIFVGLIQTASGQNKTVVDSLMRQLNKKTSQDSLAVLIPLAREYFDIDDKLSLKYITQAFKLAKQFGDSSRLVTAGRLIGQIQRDYENLEESIAILNQVRPIAKHNNFIKEYNKILNALGLAYTFKAQYDKALKCHFETLNLRIKDNDKASISTALINIGLVYYKLKNYDQARIYYLQSLSLKRAINDKAFLEGLLINLGYCYIYTKDYFTARRYIDEAFSICSGSCVSQVIMDGELGYGTIYLRLNKWKEAEYHILKSYEEALHASNKRFQMENVDLLAEIYINKKNFRLAEDYLKKVEGTYFGIGYNLLEIEIYEQFSSLYNHTGDFKNAAKYQSKYIQLRESIYSEELTQNLMVIQAEYEQKENKAKLDSQSKLLVLKEEVITRQNWLNILAGVTALLLIALIAALYKNNRQRRKTNQLLEEKVFERTTQLSESYQLIEKAYQAQTHLINKTSSDIRSPLSTMKGLCSLAMQELQDPLVNDYMIQIDIVTEQLTKMTNQLSIVMKHKIDVNQ